MVNTKKFKRSSTTSEEQVKSECLDEVNRFIKESNLEREDIIEYRTNFLGIDKINAQINNYYCEIIITYWLK